ncbi:jg26247 [Pararge aegeria aegeria]|uniref:Jg26247 protein n=1 Tax=Pararge aegeria aegeria TaxID=348720 RepID=A0A8S4R8J5_9NEOP|nr:jg26247 [Pararge aegeria aegeria]
MSNLEDKSNTNGLGDEPLKRLASLKPPRDLSLGGMKPNKKIFTPNLNVARNKNKGPSAANSRDHKKDEKNRKDRKNDRNKNLKNGPKIIKSSGVFSEGESVRAVWDDLQPAHQMTSKRWRTITEDSVRWRALGKAYVQQWTLVGCCR